MNLDEVSKKIQIALLSQALTDNLMQLDDDDLEGLSVEVHAEMDRRGMIDKE